VLSERFFEGVRYMLNVRHPPRQWHRGLSVVELLVGLALGLFLVAGAVTMFVSNLGSSRQLLVEARINQDLRSAADLIARDLRRAGYWGNAPLGTIATGSGSPVANPYSTVTPGTGIIEYTFSRDATEDNAVGGNEQFGFRRAVQGGVGVIQMKMGVVSGADNWQPVTDPQTLNIPNNGFVVTPTETVLDMRAACSRTCCTAADVAAGTAGCTATTLSSGTCPTITVREYQLALTGNAVGDANVVRTLTTRVRARNDRYAGTCPA
jgi:type IV pilus assembly protein PilW